MIRGIPNISIPAISNAMIRNGKMSFHVDSSSLIYSHFRHVSGVAAPAGTEGVSISKLKLLDVLIEQLNRIKTTGSPQSSNWPGGDSIQGGSLDDLIESYRNRIRQIRTASNAMPYITPPGASGGALFSLFA